LVPPPPLPQKCSPLGWRCLTIGPMDAAPDLSGKDRNTIVPTDATLCRSHATHLWYSPINTSLPWRGGYRRGALYTLKKSI